MSEIRQINRGLDEWADVLGRQATALRSRHMAQLVLSLRGDKLASTARLKDLALPRFDSVDGSTADFMKNPDSFFSHLRTDQYYVSVSSTDANYLRQRTFGLDQPGTYNFVKSVIADAPEAYRNLLLMETAPMLFGGNIVIGTDSENPVYGEMTDGTHSDLVGGKNPTLLLNRDPIRKLFVFKSAPGTTFGQFSEEEARTGMYEALQAIPHYGEGRDRVFHSGYYEFALVQLQANTALRPVFIDYSDQAPFIQLG